ncbi:hypothetical protein H257_11032 [Aphanomyces astaci]|uniref:C3H1-type domain-containing protein n=1 Tax=Aphanomyces astaci TaxID=112090 RepID=W4G458_APHAT|nr:hypothetical protein H257_11032 [Aphanomyces astaci]ETV74497.1 hypothetical protein H257_11032 [Aphanomyces astaci]|eukprot:XP_009836155.1 hypothetical protein H257_11032 [Aphanomyces astaci]
MPAAPQTTKHNRLRTCSALPAESICQRFAETGACKFGYRCRNLHIIDGILNGDMIHPTTTLPAVPASSNQDENNVPSPPQFARVSPACPPIAAESSNCVEWPLPRPPPSSTKQLAASRNPRLSKPRLSGDDAANKGHAAASDQLLPSNVTCDAVNNQGDGQQVLAASLLPLPPPQEPPVFLGYNMHRWLAHEIEALVHQVDVKMHTARDKQRRATMKLSGLVRELWPHVTVEVYGSTHTQLCLPHSDVDCVLVSSKTLTTSPVDMLEALMERLEACAWARHVELLRSARIPILKLHFVKCRHPVKMDVTCGHSPGHSGMEARGVVDQYRMAMPALRPLVIVLKSHLHAKGLNASYSGGLSSYALVLMVVRFLQFQGDVHTAFKEELEPHTDEGRQPCVIYTFFRTGMVVWQGTIGMLLLQFLDLHIHFDFHRYGMSIANGGEYFEIDPAATAVSFPPVSPMVYIMDPLRYNHNIGNSFRIHEIVHAWRVWRDQILQRVSLKETLT